MEDMKLFENNNRVMELDDMNDHEIRILQKYEMSEYNRLVSRQHYIKCQKEIKKIEYECRLQTKEGICDKCERPKTNYVSKIS